jgi:hypothetical protein
MTTIETLLDLLAQHGGSIVSTASLSLDQIAQARASYRLYVDDHFMGYVWEPSINPFPETKEEIEWFEKWYPLPVELPEQLKDAPILLNSEQEVKECDTSKAKSR